MVLRLHRGLAECGDKYLIRFSDIKNEFFFVGLASLLMSGVLLAQSTTQGAISGTVLDPSNAVLSNVAVTLKSLDKGYAHETTTRRSGPFQFPLIEPGHYEYSSHSGRLQTIRGEGHLVNVETETIPP